MRSFLLVFVSIGVAVGIFFVYEGIQDGSINRLIGKSSEDAPKVSPDSAKQIKAPDIPSANTVLPTEVNHPINTQIPQNMSTKFDPVQLGHLPEVNLKDLYPSINDPLLDADLKKIDTMSDNFVKKYKGKIAKSNADLLVSAIKDYEKIVEVQYKLSEIASISRDLDTTNVDAIKLCDKVEQKNADCSAKTTFFSLEIINIPETQLAKLYKDKKFGSALAKYRPFINDVRKYSKYILSEELEKICIQKNITASEAWSVLYGNVLSSIRVKINGEEYPISQVSNFVTDKDLATRKAVSDEIGKNLKNNSMAITMSLNSIIKTKAYEDQLRGYKTPITQRNLMNDVDDAAVESLLSVSKANYEKTVQRYYKIKAKILGLQKLHYSDRLAPMPFDDNNTKIIEWDNAKATVLESYQKFSPKISEIADKFFANDWIDARLLPNKIAGAYCDLGVPSNHPYILLSYNGKNRDVMTIAHEVGHGVHSILSYPVGILMFQPGLTVAETASLFGEKLTFNSLLSKASTDKQKAALLASKIEENLNAIFMAVAVADFENKIHNMAKNGTLSTEDINKVWVANLTSLYGDSVELSDLDAYRWASIGHIFRYPFYYYAYAFSQLVVDSLYDIYDKKSIKDFESKYIEMLSSGGTKKYRELLAPFGLDPLKPDFWQNGINITIKMIDDFENLVNNDSSMKPIDTNLPNNASLNQPVTELSVSIKSEDVKPVEPINMVTDSSVKKDAAEAAKAPQLTIKIDQDPSVKNKDTDNKAPDTLSPANTSDNQNSSANPAKLVVKLPK